MTRKRKQTAIIVTENVDDINVTYSPEVLKELKEIQPSTLRECGKTYINAFVTFLDILGFQKLVLNKSDEEINIILDGMHLFSKQPQRRSSPYDKVMHTPMVSQFSDSIIRIQPVALNDMDINIADLFLGELQALLLAQGNLVCNGILIRGGMTFGNICIHSDRIFGPAFNRAYLLESSLANYPRIVVDENLCTESEKDNPLIKINGLSSWYSDIIEIGDYLERADDGLWHINYLPALFSAERYPPIPGIDVLIAHRDQLLRLLKEAEGDINILKKVRWAISYHNRIVQKNFKKILNEYEKKFQNDSLLIDY